MLFNTKWEVKADPLSLDSLIAWLENQPPEKTYCYMDTGDCLIHQYFTFAGVDVESVGSTVYSLNSDPYEDLAMPQGIQPRCPSDAPYLRRRAQARTLAVAVTAGERQ